VKALRIFVSSPGDVGRERVIAGHVLKRLQGEFSRRVKLHPYFWEHEPMRATTDFQGNIPKPSEFDIVICILWSRLGSPLNEKYRRSDGTPYASGTEYEFEDATQARQLKGKPELLVYRNRQQPMIPIEPEEERNEKIRQFEALQTFLKRWFLNLDGTVRIATNDYEDLAAFEEKLERNLRVLIEEAATPLSGRHDDAVVPRTYAKGSPFRQLRPFEFEDADIFFGRTKAIDDVLTAMREQAAEGAAFTLILGSSGSGKSSLARAGVLPMLVRPGVIEGIGLWRRTIIRPSEAAKDIFEGVAAALVATEGLPELVSDGGVSVADLARALREAPSGVPLLVKRCLAEIDREVQAKEGLARQPVGKLIILVDQFEEVFTQQDLFPPETRVRFVTALGELARSGTVWVLVTLRSEFFNRCEEIPELVALKGRKGQYQLLPPAESQLRQIVRLPAIAAGLQFEVDSDGRSLDDVLVDSAGRHPGSLPLLELTLEELYKRRRDDCWLTHSALEEVKGIEGALETTAESVFQKLPTEVAAEFNQVFRALVTVNLDEEAAFVRRIAYLDLLAGTPSQRKLIDAFVEARLLVAGGDPGTRPILQVAHEALFLHWPRLERLLDDNREFLRRRARATAALNLWRTQQRNRSYLWWHGRLLGEARDLLAHAEDLTPAETEFAQASVEAGRSARRKRATATVLAASIAVAAGASGFLWWRSWHTEKEVADLRAQLARVTATLNPNPYELADLSRRILDKNPHDSDVWVLYSKALLDQGDQRGFEAALQRWQRSVPRPAAKIEDLRGDDELKRGDEQAAINHWSAYLDEPSVDLQARTRTWKKLEQAYGHLGQWEQARTVLTQWIRAQDNIEARVLRAKANQQLRNWEAVRDDITFAQKSDPTNPAVKNFGLIMDERTIKSLNDRVNKQPRDPAAWLARATELARNRQFQAALEDIEHALNLDPDSTRLAIEKAFLLWQLRRPTPVGLSARELETWARDEPKFRSTFEAMQPELDELSSLDARIKNGEQKTDLYFERGCKLAQLGQHSLALRDFKRVLDANDRSIKTLEARAASYRALDQADLADEDLRRVQELQQPQLSPTP
jgi:tetratricopeptide (TPR) repeat protein